MRRTKLIFRIYLTILLTGVIVFAQSIDQSSKSNGSSNKKGANKKRVDYCCNFDSDRNVGLAPVLVNFTTLKEHCEFDWDLDIEVRSGLEEPGYAYWDDERWGGKPIEPSFNGKDFPGFVQIYEPGGLGELQVVYSSPSLKYQTWDNAVDGDTYWDNGTAVVSGDQWGPPWAIFQFADKSIRKVNKIRFLNDTGICDGEGSMECTGDQNGKNSGKGGSCKGGGCSGGSGGHDDGGDDGGCGGHDDGGDDGGGGEDDDGGGCSHEDEGDESGSDGGHDSGGGCSHDDGGCSSGDDGCSHTGTDPCNAKFVSRFKLYTSSTHMGGSAWRLVLDEYMDANTFTPCDLLDGWFEWEIPEVKAKYFMLVIEEPITGINEWVHIGEFEVWYDATLADPGLSQIQVSGDNLSVDGEDAAEIHLNLFDKDGIEIAGLTGMDIKFYSKQIYGQDGVDNECNGTDEFYGLTQTAPGQYKCYWTSSIAGQKDLWVSVNGVVIKTLNAVTFGSKLAIGQGDYECVNPKQLVFVKGTETYSKGDQIKSWDNINLRPNNLAQLRCTAGDLNPIISIFYR